MARARHSLEGKQIQDVVDDLSRQYIDVEVEAEFKRGQYEGTRSLDTKRFRVVGVQRGRRRLPSLYHESTARGVLPSDL